MNDLWNLILLEANPSDMLELALVNRHVYKILTSQHFWTTRFKKDNLPLLHPRLTLGSWIAEYKYTDNCQGSGRATFGVAIDRIHEISIFFVPGVDERALERWYSANRRRSFAHRGGIPVLQLCWENQQYTLRC